MVRAALAANDLKNKLNSLDAENMMLVTTLAESAAAPGNSRTLSIGPDGAMSFAGQKKMSLEEMKAVVATNRIPSLVIRADERVPLEIVTTCVQALKSAGTVEFSFEDGRIGDGRFRIANRTGRYDLGGGCDLYLCRPDERSHWFTVRWPALDGQPRQQWSVYPKVSPAKRDTLVAGDYVQLTILRDATASRAFMPLDWYQGITRHDYADPSLRLSGLPAVFTHDVIVGRRQCGGPVVDLDGRVVGVNIARLDRFSTLAIPPQSIWELVRKLSTSASTPKAPNE